MPAGRPGASARPRCVCFGFYSRVAIAALAAILAVALPGAARAQIVNIQPLLDKQTHPGFSAVVAGSADWRTGNTNLLLLSGNTVGQYRRRRQLVFLMLHGEFGVNAGVKLVSKDLEHLRYRYRLNRALDLESFVQHDRDDFRRLAVRALLGGGARLRVVDGKHVTFAVAADYMLEYEELATGMYPDSGDAVLDQRLSTYAVLAVAGAHVAVAHTVYAQPRFDDFSDVRMLHDSQLSLFVTKHLSVHFNVTLTLDTRPPSGVQPLDTALKTTLAATF